MRSLREAGVTAGVMMAPILPGLTDSAASIEAVAAAARDHRAAYFSTAPLRLAPHVKEFYLGFVGDEYPDLLPPLQRAYPGAYAPLTIARNSRNASTVFARRTGLAAIPERLAGGRPAGTSCQTWAAGLALPSVEVAFADEVYALGCEVPRGRVITYGTIARLLADPAQSAPGGLGDGHST